MVKKIKPIDISKTIFEVTEKKPGGVYFITSEDFVEMKTSKGTIIESSNYNLINTICDELNTMSKLDDSSFSYFSIYSIQYDWIPDHFNLFIDELENMILGDITLKSCAGPEIVEQMAKWTHLNDFLGSQNLEHPNYLQVPDVSAVKEWVYSNSDTENNSYIENHQNIIKLMLDRIHELSDAEKASLIALSNISQSLLHSYLLIKGKCNPNDFAHAVFAGWSIHPKFYEDELEGNKDFIEDLIKCANMVNTYVSISSMKSEKDTWIELEKIRTDPTISKDLIKISKIISHDLDYELFVDFLSSFNRELFVLFY